MLIGFATKKVNPAEGTLLGGYPTDEPRRVVGVHDDLVVMALSCRAEIDDDRTVLLAFDGIAVPEELVVALHESFDPSVRVIPVASHTHAAPSVRVWDQEILGDHSPEYSALLVARSIEAVGEAIASEATGQISVGLVDLKQPVGGNRRKPGGIRDESVRVLDVRDEKGNPTTMFVILGCHPTVLDAENELASSDLVWGIRESLRDIPVAFLPGGAGNQSTRSTRKESTFAECRRLGGVVGRSIEAAPNMTPCSISRYVETSLRVEPRQFAGVAEASQRLDHWLFERDRLKKDHAPADVMRAVDVQLIGARHALRRARSGFRHPGVDVRIARWDLGQVGIAFWPVEPGLELAREVEAEGRTWLTGYAGGYYGYLLDPEDYSHGGYEVAASLFDGKESPRFIRATRRLSAAER